MKYSYYLALLLMSIFGNFNLQSQDPFINNGGQLISERLTNRPLGFLSDASAVAWNPSLLGVRSGTFDATFFAPYFDLNGNIENGNSYGGFLSYSPVSFGYVTGSDWEPGQIYTGLGFPIISETLWFGVSGAAILPPAGNEDAGMFDNLRYNASFLYSPNTRMLFSVGLSNMNTLANQTFIGYFQAMYSPLDWLSFNADIRYAGQEVFFNNSQISPSFGLSFGVLKNMILSTSYNTTTEIVRVGFEWGVFNAIHDVIPNTDGAGRGLMILKFNDDAMMNVADVGGKGARLSGDYPTDCYPGQYYWKMVDDERNSRQMMELVNGLGKEYDALKAQLKEMSPDPDSVFIKITQKYYNQSDDDIAGDLSNYITTKQGHTVYVLSNDTSDTKILSTVMVRDRLNRNVSSLKTSHFAIKDTNYYVTNLEETASEKSVPVDIVFTVDASGSMSDKIKAVLDNLNNFSNMLEKRGADVRVGAILFGNYILKEIPLTNNFAKFKEKIIKFGVADDAYAECTPLAIKEAANMDFRDDAERIVISITDECTMQSNINMNEGDLVNHLWKNGVKLFSMIDINAHNAGIVTRLSMGRDYNIFAPISKVMEEITGDITTTYIVEYERKPTYIEPPKVFYVRGNITNTDGWKIGAEVAVTNKVSNQKQNLKANKITGSFLREYKDFANYQFELFEPGYRKLEKSVDLTKMKFGDTVTLDFVLERSPTSIYGTLKDENGNPIQGEILISALDGTEIKKFKTDANGFYELDIPEGNSYIARAIKKEFIGEDKEFSLIETKKGERVELGLSLMSIAHAIDIGKTFAMKNILFDTGKWDIKSESEPELANLIEFLNEYLSVRVEIGAHTDDVGKDEANMTLSENRARSVVEYLVSKGITDSRLVWKGYGETTPLVPNSTKENRALNRRVEFKLIK